MFRLGEHGSDPAAAAPNSVSRGLDLSAVAERVRHRVWLVLACGVAALIAAVVAIPLLPTVYTAQVQILIDPADLRVLDNGVQPNSPLADSGVSVAESQVKVLGSDSVLSRVVSRLGLDADPEFVRPTPAPDSATEIVKRLLGLAPVDMRRDPPQQAVDELRSKMTIRRPERTFVIELLVRSSDPEKAARIANTAAEIYFAQELQARTTAAGRASDALAARLGELRTALQAAEDRLAKFREDNRLVATNGRLLVDQRLGELNAQLTAASIRTAEARARADQARQLRGADGTALPEMLQSTEMRALRQQQADLARILADLATKLGPRHPSVGEQSAQLRETDRVIAREKTRIIDSTLKELDRSVAAEAAIRVEIEKLKRETTVNERAMIGLREYERDVEAERALYETFLRRSRETGQQERIDTTNMRVISPAVAPLGRSWPPSPKVLLPAALVFGLLLGAALAALWPARPATRRRPAAAGWGGPGPIGIVPPAAS